MRFYFDIDDDRFEDELGIDFQKTVKECAVYSIAENVFSSSAGDSLYNECDKAVRQMVKDHSQEIIDRVIERVADNISRKKSILEMTPKASQLAAIDKENIAYFEEMIDKAIAKRFGS